MQRFYALIDRYNAAGREEAARIEREIWDTFGVERAAFVLDMSGFSLAVRRGGIVRYLGMVRHMQRVGCELVEAAGGEVVKLEADNLFAAFADVAPAVQAAIGIHHRFAELNRARQDAGCLGCAIGIAFGRFLLVPGKDFYGDCVNLAAKLGEDLGQQGEILVTADAYARLEPKAAPAELVTFSVSGLRLPAWRIQC